MSPIFVDANVFLYAIGGPHPLREPCRRAVEGIVRRKVAAEISVEVVQEVAHVRNRGRGDGTARAREILAWKLRLHGFGPSDLEPALGLVDEHPGLPTRDAIHAATALNRGVKEILSADKDFDRLEGLARIDPSEIVSD
ncbi:MAG: type II toxin-antitoxin system VapC family toxin [Solirubrobacterales bacterium]